MPQLARWRIRAPRQSVNTQIRRKSCRARSQPSGKRQRAPTKDEIHCQTQRKGKGEWYLGQDRGEGVVTQTRFGPQRHTTISWPAWVNSPPPWVPVRCAMHGPPPICHKKKRYSPGSMPHQPGFQSASRGVHNFPVCYFAFNRVASSWTTPLHYLFPTVGLELCLLQAPTTGPRRRVVDGGSPLIDGRH